MVFTTTEETTVAVSFSKPFRFWSKTFQSHLGINNKASDNSNITFVCSGFEVVAWNGLAYLACISRLIAARSKEEQNFTLMLPDYEAELVKQFLDLIVTGEVVATKEEVSQLGNLVKDLGVS